MGEELVTARREGDICVVRLQREAKLNALSEQMAAHLTDALASEAVAGSRVVVIAGSARAFSAGADLTEFTDPSPEGNIAYYRGPGRIWELLPELPQLRRIRQKRVGHVRDLARCRLMTGDQ